MVSAQNDCFPQENILIYPLNKMFVGGMASLGAFDKELICHYGNEAPDSSVFQAAEQ